MTRHGTGPALRALTGHTATEEQRAAALAELGLSDDTFPLDVIFAVAGDAAKPRKADRLPKLAEPEPFDWVDDNRGAQMLGFVGSLVAAAGIVCAALIIVGLHWAGWVP